MKGIFEWTSASVCNVCLGFVCGKGHLQPSSISELASSSAVRSIILSLSRSTFFYSDFRFSGSAPPLGKVYRFCDVSAWIPGRSQKKYILSVQVSGYIYPPLRVATVILLNLLQTDIYTKWTAFWYTDFLICLPYLPTTYRLPKSSFLGFHSPTAHRIWATPKSAPRYTRWMKANARGTGGNLIMVYVNDCPLSW